MMHQMENIAEVARRITGIAISSLAERDARADGGRREIFYNSGTVGIRRKCGGIAMQLDISVRKYTGIVLTLLTDREGRPLYRISLHHADTDLGIVLYEAQDDQDIVAIWRTWANFFSLPKLLERRPGELECETRWIGATSMGSRPLWRRRGGSLNKRKPTHRIRRRNAHAIIAPFAPATCEAILAEV